MAKKPNVPDTLSLSGTDTWLTSKPVTREPLDTDAYLEFQQALDRRSDRVALGLHIPDSDAELLLGNEEWQETFFRQWTGEFVMSATGAPVAHARPSTSEHTPRKAPAGPSANKRRNSVTRQPIRLDDTVDDTAEDEASAA